MGLFDDFVKLADKGLSAVENGALEKTLGAAVDKLESGLDRAVESAEKAAVAPEKLLDAADAKRQQIERTVQTVQQHTSDISRVVRE